MCGVGKREVEVQIRARRRHPHKHLTSRSVTVCDTCARELYGELDQRLYTIGGPSD
jgi:hypothetical protein